MFMINLGYFCTYVGDLVALPAMILYVTVGIVLTIKTRFIQVRALPRLFKLLFGGVKHHKNTKNEKTINPFHALLTAMSTTIGMGNVVGPTIAVSTGGPGALFWLVAYAFFGAVTKFVEVIFAMEFRTKLKSGEILGGPTQYLKEVSPVLAFWYGSLTMVVFAGWSGQQANTLANIFELEMVPPWITGFLLALIVFIILLGGIQRIGEMASKLVPFMFVLYVTFALGILFSDFTALWSAIILVFKSAFTPCAAVGGFVGASIMAAMQQGVNRSIYITEAGLGTSSIAHAMADTDRHEDQAILAMFSVAADMILSVLSGLIVIVTGLWVKGSFSNTLVYEAFKVYSPGVGKWVLLLSITLFVLTTVIGNSFNASQSFASFTKYKWMLWYYFALSAIIFVGALADVTLIWKVMDLFQVLVAVPHLIGLLILSFKKGKLIHI
ncbi:MAG: AGCS family alanine or glycine:cation symporter [Alteromonas naphthalenivorans]|jgi:AGCS family alanine or glycine:cation symporter